MKRIWTRKLTLMRLGVVLVLMGVLGVVIMGSQPVSAASVTSISSGKLHTCVVTTTGGVKCWGINEFGRLGDGTTTNSSVPVNVAGLTGGISAVTAGFVHTCALTTTGGVKCWGATSSVSWETAPTWTARFPWTCRAS